MLVIDQLVAEGKIRMEDTIAQLLPDYPNAEVARKVTVERMLDHSSGLGDFFGERFEATPQNRLRSLQDYVPLFVDQPLLFEPGTSRRYSNVGYIVLGLIIERVTGRSYYDVARERIFDPLGMKETASYEADEVVPGLACGYTSRSEAGGPADPRRNIYSLPGRGSSAGGGYSTAGDLLRFAQGLREGRVSGTERWRRQGGLAIAGGSPGVNGVVEDDWESGWTVIVLANIDPPSAEQMARVARSTLSRVRT
jgi:CubicO group peptidase (beta-lactamase class C family)